MSNSQSWTAVLAAEAILWDIEGWKWQFDRALGLDGANRSWRAFLSAHLLELA